MKKSTAWLSNLCAVAASFLQAAIYWDSVAFEKFLECNGLLKCLPLVANCVFHLVYPLCPSPPKVQTLAVSPSTKEARIMALCTALFDYSIVGALFLYWNKVLSGPTLCPFSAACAIFLLVPVLIIKDEFQGRKLWPNFISRAKLNAWPYNWDLACQHFLFQVPYFVASFYSFVSAGVVVFPSIFDSGVLFTVWLEAMSMSLLEDTVSWCSHRWMHSKNGYRFHKSHHHGTQDLGVGNHIYVDLLDNFLEVGISFPMLLGAKMVFGFEPTMHYLSMMLWIMMGFQNHTMNPYSPYFFNPIIDFVARSNVSHNLHHATQQSHYTNIPWSHFWRPLSKKDDIDTYNRYMKTKFPVNV